MNRKFFASTFALLAAAFCAAPALAENATDWKMAALLRQNKPMAAYIAAHFPDVTVADAGVGYDNLCNVYGCSAYGPYSSRFWISFGKHTAGGSTRWNKDTNEFTLKVEFPGESTQPEPIKFFSGAYGYFEQKDAFRGLALDGMVGSDYSACAEMLAANPGNVLPREVYECEGNGNLDSAGRYFRAAEGTERSCVVVTDSALFQFGRTLDDRGWAHFFVLPLGKNSALPAELTGTLEEEARSWSYAGASRDMSWKNSSESGCSWHIDFLGMGKTWECASDTEAMISFNPQTGKLQARSVTVPRGIAGLWSRTENTLVDVSCRAYKK